MGDCSALPREDVQGQSVGQSVSQPVNQSVKRDSWAARVDASVPKFGWGGWIWARPGPMWVCSDMYWSRYWVGFGKYCSGIVLVLVRCGPGREYTGGKLGFAMCGWTGYNHN